LVSTKLNDNFIKCYVSKSFGKIKYVEDINNKFSSNVNFNKYKVAFTEAFGEGFDYYKNYFIIPPSEICNKTYRFVSFDTEIEALNFIKYANSYLFKFLLCISKTTQHTNPQMFKLFPDLDFKQNFEEEQLKTLFNFSNEEINFMNKFIDKK
jgi:site-specific DNA-methyltransferase (adenine-specific)